MVANGEMTGDRHPILPNRCSQSLGDLLAPRDCTTDRSRKSVLDSIPGRNISLRYQTRPIVP